MLRRWWAWILLTVWALSWLYSVTADSFREEEFEDGPDRYRKGGI